MFTYEVEVKVCVLLKISIAVISHHNQELLGKMWFISLTFPHHHSSFKKVSAGTQVAGILGQEIILRPWGSAVYSLSPHELNSLLFFYYNGTIRLGVGQPIMHCPITQTNR